MDMFQCEKCGTCCRYHKCKYLTDNNTCRIYDTRPERCNVSKMYDKLGAGLSREQYYKTMKASCNLLRIKEWLDPMIESMFDKKYEQERVNFRR